jgi:hypothetical protein
MTEREWKRVLKTYRTPEQVAREALEGVTDHLAPCRTGRRTTAYVRNRYSGVGPVDVAAVCSRGTAGCDLNHNDLQALRFCELSLQRIVELTAA